MRWGIYVGRVVIYIKFMDVQIYVHIMLYKIDIEMHR